MLIPLRQAQIECLNEERIDVSNLGNFMKYYLVILQIAFNFSLISEKERDIVAGLILREIESRGNAIVASNYIYAMSTIFCTMKNSQCLEMMQKVHDVYDAKNFVDDIEKIFKKRIEEILRHCNLGISKAMKINDSNILENWNTVKYELSNVYRCFESDSRIELKNMHVNMHFPLPTYQLLRHDEGKNYIDSAESAVENFLMENSIMLKIGAENLIPKIIEERRKLADTLPEFEKEKKVRKIIVDLHSKREKAQKKYEFYLNKISISEEAFQRKLEEFEEFEKKHPEMSQEDCDYVFDEMLKKWEESEEYCPLELIKVQQRFETIFFEIDEKIKKYESELDYILDEKALAECSITQTLDITLLEIMIEYNLIFLTNDGVISYPNTILEKQNILVKISNESVRENFVNKSEFKFSEKEKKYLLP